MNAIARILVIAPLVAGSPLLRADAVSADSWTRPRAISDFQSLLARSPFSLPTAEESSPLADRYALTGAVAIDGEPLVFVIDRTTQERRMVSKKPSDSGILLVEYLPDPDPRRMRATIKVGSEMATISYVEIAQPAMPQAGPQNTVMPGPPQPVAAMPMPGNPGQPGPAQPVVAPGAPGAEPPRRIIRRRVISGQPGQ